MTICSTPSALFLNTEQVSTASAAACLTGCAASLAAHEDLSQLLANNANGVVHARIGLPIDLVNRGAQLKDELCRVLKTKADYSSSAERCYLFAAVWQWIPHWRP